MHIELPTFWVVLLNTAGWPVIQLVLAWSFTRLPVSWFARAPESAAGERRGRLYERLCFIKHWKDKLPDGASWMRGGFAKQKLNQASNGYIRRFIAETRRGEFCHWSTLAFTPVFFLWNPPWAEAVMLAYGLATNVPCILAQRYNRLRLRRLLYRKAVG